jgi:radical SAM/Cys-rich protein
MVVAWQGLGLRKSAIRTVQLNLGNRCNQCCLHCHVRGSPRGRRNMSMDTALKVLQTLRGMDVQEVEFTGGAPELNPALPVLIEGLSATGRLLSVRTNLTVLELPQCAPLAELFLRHGVKLVASLPSCFRDETDAQRGRGVFEASIRVLRRLNELGYGQEGGPALELVYNPQGEYLPPSETELQARYRRLLWERHRVRFSRLVAMVNAPIGGFRRYLRGKGKLREYMQMLLNNFNPRSLQQVMCRSLLSVDYQGYLYDCDFNQALGIRVKGYEDKRLWEVDFSQGFNPPITCQEHCYACTAARGSGCRGELLKEEFKPKEVVKRYYGKTLRGSADLKSTACCPSEAAPEHVRRVLELIADEVKEKFYGCGSPIPLVLKGLRVLDLGSGTGRDCFVLSKLVGPEGFVWGLDMTEEQVEVARRHIGVHMERFGYREPNVAFILEEMENLGRHFGAESLDLVVSNCVFNLLEDKLKVLREVWRVLKFGGELYFSDIYADRRLPRELRENPLLWGECLGGALYVRDFLRLARQAGFAEPRLMSRRQVQLNDPEVKALVGPVRFYSITYRLWKLRGLEEHCEDYGHVATYRGTVAEAPHRFHLDRAHVFEAHRPERVCGNTALMLSATRLSRHFTVEGDFGRHFGPFRDCRSTAAREAEEGGCC